MVKGFSKIITLAVVAVSMSMAHAEDKVVTRVAIPPCIEDCGACAALLFAATAGCALEHLPHSRLCPCSEDIYNLCAYCQANCPLPPCPQNNPAPPLRTHIKKHPPLPK